MRQNATIIAILLCFFLSSSIVQSQSSSTSISNLNGVPDNIEIEKSYTKSSSVLFLNGTSVPADSLTDLDISFMEPRTETVEYYHGRNAIDSSIMICKIPDPSTYFNEGSLKYSHNVHYGDTVYFYKLDGSYLYKTHVISDPPSGDDIDTLTGDFTVNNDEYEYSDDEITIKVDTTTKSIFQEYRDESGIWQSRMYKQYSEVGNRYVLTSRMRMLRKTTPSGKCIFQLTHEERSDYYLKTEETEPRKLTIEKPGIIIEPNPVVNTAQIILDGFNDRNEARGKVYTMDGKVVKEFTVDKSIEQIDCSSLVTGAYIIVIQGNDFVLSSKIIKN